MICSPRQLRIIRDAIKEDGRAGHMTRKRRIGHTGIWREKLKEWETV